MKAESRLLRGTVFGAALILLWGALPAMGDETRSIRVFVALCDNKSQGIVPVGERIGDGDRPEANLYWGCSDGFDSYFSRSRQWQVRDRRSDPGPSVLRRTELSHVSGALHLVADAYRGSEIRKCLVDFEKAAASGEFDLVAFIGHNGLMDFSLPEVEANAPEENGTDAVILACLSQPYFGERLTKMGCRPILMTRQLMYPGSFLLHDAIEVWRKGGTQAEIRGAAGRAYARNQGIAVRAATGVFADLED